jgi:hypothetical protein
LHTHSKLLPGISTSEKVNNMRTVHILTRPVRQLRSLSSSEVRNLRAAGVSCSSAWLVSPTDGTACGYLYRPAARNSGAFATNAGILALAA